MFKIFILGFLVTYCFCDNAEINIENKDSSNEIPTKKPCSPLLGHCNRPGQCCEPHVCLTYLAKCVTGDLSGMNNTVNSIESTTENKEESTDTTKETETSPESATSCSKIGGYCLTTTDCCKPFLCLSYAAKCVSPNLKETKI